MSASNVVTCLEGFLTTLGKMPEALTPELALYADGIGLDSLETAELSAVLEDEFGSDPFSGAEMPETVGDLIAFYDAAAGS
ncbi:MAG: hypothetical protein ACJ72D_15105 [Marmoricola sp.]